MRSSLQCLSDENVCRSPFLADPLSADEGVAIDDEAEGVFDGFADADAGSGADEIGFEAVVKDLQRGGAAGDVEAVVGGAGDVEGLTEASGAGGEQARRGAGRQLAQAGHGVEACDGLKGADEDAAGVSIGLAGDVQAVVHPVDEVDVGEAGGAEEDGVAGGLAVIGVGGGVVEAEVGFDLDDASSEGLAVPTACDEFAEETAGHDVGRVEVEASGQELGHSRLSGCEE